MQISYILFAVAAVLTANVDALPHLHRRSNCRSVSGNENIGDTSGLLNNVLANGLLNDNSQKSQGTVICDDDYDYDHHKGWGGRGDYDKHHDYDGDYDHHGDYDNHGDYDHHGDHDDHDDWDREDEYTK